MFRFDFLQLCRNFQQTKMSDLGQIRDAQVARNCENKDFANLNTFDHIEFDFRG